MSYRIPLGATSTALVIAGAGIVAIALALRARIQLQRFRRPGVPWWWPELGKIDRARDFAPEGASHFLRATLLGWSGLGLLMLALIVWLAMQAL